MPQLWRILVVSGILVCYSLQREPLHARWCLALITPPPTDQLADLTLVALSERLGVAEILTLDGDFDVYRRYRKQPFRRGALV